MNIGSKANAGIKDKVIVSTFGYGRSPIFTKTINYYGGIVCPLPLLKLSLARNLTEFDRCVRKLAMFDVVIFSSPTMVDLFFLRFDQLALKRSSLDDCYVLSIGSETTRALNRHGVDVDASPRKFTSDKLVEMLKQINKVWKVLIPCSDRSLWQRKDLFSGTKFKVFRPTLYCNEMAEIDSQQTVNKIINKDFDGIALTSPSAVEYLSILCSGTPLASLLSQKVVASIGPTTSAACRAMGVNVTLEPRKNTIASLMWMLIFHFENGCNG